VPNLASPAIHALTVGAMGTMILAVMTRATLGHSKRELTAGHGTLVVYMLVLLAAVARVVPPILETGYALVLDVAGVAWIAAFALWSGATMAHRAPPNSASPRSRNNPPLAITALMWTSRMSE
jgi:uncharacterized protein involved in response to NO